MGLDMYLYRVPKVENLDKLSTIQKRLDKAFIEGNLLKELSDVKKELGFIYDIDFSLPSYFAKEDVIEKYKNDPDGWGSIVDLSIRVAYWRKFNALHNWMVENVQGGNDDCGDYIVNKEDLKKLLSDLEQVNAENASEKFPTRSGFFFGGTNYNEYYFREIEELKATVVYLLNQQPYETTYIYSSSW